MFKTILEQQCQTKGLIIRVSGLFTVGQIFLLHRGDHNDLFKINISFENINSLEGMSLFVFFFIIFYSRHPNHSSL